MRPFTNAELLRKDRTLTFRTDRLTIRMLTEARRLLHDQLPDGIISNNSDVVRLGVTFLLHKMGITPNNTPTHSETESSEKYANAETASQRRGS